MYYIQYTSMYNDIIYNIQYIIDTFCILNLFGFYVKINVLVLKKEIYIMLKVN